MISFIFLLIILGFITAYGLSILSAGLEDSDRKIPIYLVFWHALLAAAYFGYAIFNRSDSRYYYYKASSAFLGPNWFDYYGVSTTFIDFLTFPLVQYFGLSYEAAMLFYAWLGLIGFLLFFITLKENLVTRPTFFGYDLLTIILFLPNLHFWSSSIGKGSIAFLGFGLFFYGLSKFGQRWLWALLGGVIIYHVRPHILFITLIASALGYLFSSSNVGTWGRVAIVLISLIGFYFIAADVLALTGIDEEAILQESTTLSRRAFELSKATSGVNISGYSFPLKLFTFWFRPLFFDAPGALGIIVSFENVIYLLLFLKIVNPAFIFYMLRSDAIIKTSAITFLGVSFALAQLSGNLGLAMRQKSQVMILLMFVILKFLDEKQQKIVAEEQRRKEVLATQLEQIKASRAREVSRRTLN